MKKWWVFVIIAVAVAFIWHKFRAKVSASIAPLLSKAAGYAHGGNVSNPSGQHVPVVSQPYVESPTLAPHFGHEDTTPTLSHIPLVLASSTNPSTSNMFFQRRSMLNVL